MNTDCELNLLCVDDEQGILRSLKRLLRSESFGVLSASSGAEALELLASESIQVIVADQRMPDMSGTRLLEKVKEEHPDVIRVVLSGFADVTSILESINRGEVFRYLAKPWNDDELKTMLRQCFAQFNLEQENKKLISMVNEQNTELEKLNSMLAQQVEEQQLDLSSSEDNLQQAETGLRILRGVVQNIPLPLFGIDDNGQIVIANAQAIALAGNNVAIGNELADVVGNDVDSRIKQQLQMQKQQIQELSEASDSQLKIQDLEDIDVSFGRVRAFPLAVDDKNRGGIVVITQSTA
jgi:response regulator RpfG family c-di-GMP phosphodiesterase